MSEREERIGFNEAVFRQVNEQLETLQGGRVATLLELVCECGRPECGEGIAMTPEAYERIRADPTLFALAPGHALLDIETVVETHEAYEVVQKRTGKARKLAEETDPRSP